MSIAFLFPGQGAQHPGMGAELCQAYPQARAVFDEVNEILGRDIRTLALNGPDESLNHTINTQPCLLAAEAAALIALAAEGVCPDIVAGFSLGEWTALVAAGVLRLPEVFRLIELRAQAMQNAVPVGQGAMAAILGKDAAFVEALCVQVEGYVVPSNYNCPGQITVAGKNAAVDALLALCESTGIAAKKLAVSIPSHCNLMKPAAEKLSDALEKVIFQEPHIPLVMNATGQAVREGQAVKTNILRQLTYPVRFQESLETMFARGVDTFVEVGPGKTLSAFVKKTAKAAGRAITVLRAGDIASFEETITVLKG